MKDVFLTAFPDAHLNSIAENETDILWTLQKPILKSLKGVSKA